MDFREFSAESLEGAVEKAAKHFGVGPNRIQVSVLSERLKISGAAGRVVVLASIREEPVELGPVGEFLAGVLERMGISGARIDEEHQEDLVVLRVRSAPLRDLTRRDQRVAGALVHLATRVAQRRVREDAKARIDLEGGSGGAAGGDSNANEERLERLAQTKAREAKSRGEEVVLAPMNARERWVVHNALKSMQGVRSESVGEGLKKRVKIVPL